MIIIMKPGASKEAIHNVTCQIETRGLQVHLSEGREVTIVGVVGDKSLLNGISFEIADGVDKVVPVTESYKLANRKFHPEPSLVPVGNTSIGPGTLTIMAGPCAVESREQLLETAVAVKKAGANFLRGGAYKPRTSPYSFQGLKGDGLKLLLEAKEKTGLPIVSEIMNAVHIPMFEDVDLVQVGARNMQNFELLKELGKIQKPILLKRGLANTIDELLMSAEYIMTGGNENIILCERGIRTFETRTRNTLDLSAIPVLKKLTHLPVVVDPSHAVGYSQLVKPLAMAAAAVGADGLMIEVHNDPSRALCDGPQSLTPEAFDDLAKSVFALQPFACSYDEDSPNENKAYEDYFF